MSAVEPQYYDYNRHKLMFDSEDDSADMRSWEDQLESADIPLVVDMSHWIGCITRCTLPYDMFLDRISDGTILCNFGNTINAMTGFGARRQISNIMYPDTESEGEGTSHDRHNIASFLQWCKTYGLEREWLFSVSDLADKQDGRRVLRALLWIGRLAHRRGVPAPQIVKIEEKYGMRYYTFMMRIITETPIPVQVLFKEEEEQTKEKRSSRISVTSFFGRRSSRTSVNSNASVNSSNLPSITEDRKRSIIGGNKKDKKKKKKGSTVVNPDETEIITPNNDIQQIYMQIMSLVYHKGFQRAKPKGYQSAAIEDWQAELHSTDPTTLPVEDFSTVPNKAWSVNSLNKSSPTTPAANKVTPTPTSDFFMSTFSVDPPSNKDPLGAGHRANIFHAVQERDPDSSSDGAFADDDLQQLRKDAGKKRRSPDNQVPGGNGQETDDNIQGGLDGRQDMIDSRNGARPSDGRVRSPDGKIQSLDDRRQSPDDRRRSPDDRRQSPDNRRLSPDDRRRSSDDKRRSPDDRRQSPDDRRLSPDDNRRSPNEIDDRGSLRETRLEAIVHNIYPNRAGEEDGEKKTIREKLDEEADNEIRSITDKMKMGEELALQEDSTSASINANPKINFDDVDSDISGLKRKDRIRKTHLRSPDLRDAAKKEQGIKNSDKVDVMPPDTKYGSLDRANSTSRQRSYSRQQSYSGGTGLTLGQVLLIIICPCRLCFGSRR